MVDVADQVARGVAYLKAAQLRNFYGSLLRIEARLMDINPAALATEFQLLRPKLQYMANRENAARPLETAFDALLEKAAEVIVSQGPDQARQTARCVFEFAEAVVAYHRERRQG